MHRLSHAVNRALVDLLAGAPLSRGKIDFAWRMVVGPALERVTSVRLEGRTLIVEASSPQWGREVARSSALILGRLQALLGKEALETITVREHAREP